MSSTSAGEKENIEKEPEGAGLGSGFQIPSELLEPFDWMLEFELGFGFIRRMAIDSFSISRSNLLWALKMKIRICQSISFLGKAAS